MNTGCRLRGNPRRLERELPASRGRLEGGAQGEEAFGLKPLATRIARVCTWGPRGPYGKPSAHG
jgi:hypothetical protein